MSQEETRFRRFPLACCQISELNCSKAPLNRRSSTTILSNICLIAAPILAPNLPISGNTAEYPATGSSIKNPVFMRVCGHFEARRTTRHDPNVITPKRGVGGSNPLWDARKHRCKPFFGVCSVFLFLLLPVISLPLPGDFYTPHDVYLLIGLERFSEIC